MSGHGFGSRVSAESSRRTAVTVYRIDWKLGRGSPCFGITVGPSGFVVEAAPIAKWAVGKPWTTVSAWFIRKGAAIHKLEDSCTHSTYQPR